MTKPDTYPFGDEITSTSNDREKFATYTRDSYTGLDYADQRYFASTYGRFNTADPYQASGGPESPASWNMYGYVRNNPLRFIDPSGLCSQDSSGGYQDSDDGGTLLFSGPCSGGTIGNYNPSPTAPPVLNGPDPNNPAVEGNTVTGSFSDIDPDEFPDPRFNSDPTAPTDAQRNQMLGQLVYARTAHDLACSGLGFVVGGTGAAGVAAGQPTPGTKRFVTPGSSQGTSVLSETLRDATGGARGGPRLPTPVGGPGTGTPLRIARTNSVGAFWGRWAPFFSGALTAVGAYETYSCLSTTPH